MSQQEGIRVFVVDDESIIAKTLAVILQNCGYVASYFTNPLEALSTAENDAPDLLISDVVMPELSGVELAIRISALYPDCKVLLFSGQAQTADLLHVAREQGHQFQLLTKPVHPSDLLRQIGQQLNTHKVSAGSS